MQKNSKNSWKKITIIVVVDDEEEITIGRKEGF